jgi:hypothetical protein
LGLVGFGFAFALVIALLVAHLWPRGPTARTWFVALSSLLVGTAFWWVLHARNVLTAGAGQWMAIPAGFAAALAPISGPTLTRKDCLRIFLMATALTVAVFLMQC